MSNVGYATLTVIPSAKGFGKALDGEVQPQLGSSGDKAGKSMGGKAVGALGGVLKKGALVVGGAAGGILSTALFKGWNRLTAIEDAQAKLRGLGHDTGTVKLIMDNALASVKGTAFGLGDAATVAAGVVASGIKPGKELERTLRLVGDAATISGSDLSEMGSIFNKVAASGKLQGDVIAQLGDRGIPILQLLGKEIGKTPAEVAKLASQGKIDFATFQNAMEKGLGGAALKSGETTKGAFANMQAALGRFGAELLKNVFPIAKQVFGGLTGFIDTATNAVKPFVAQISGLLGPAFKTIGDAVTGFFASLQGGGGASSILSSLGSTFQTLVAFGQSLIPTLQQIGQNIMGVVGPGFQSVVQVVTGTFLPAVRNILPVLQPIAAFLLNVIGGAVVGALQGAFKVIQGVFTMISGLFNVFASLIKGDWEGVWNGIKQFLGGALQAILGAIQVWWNVGILGAFKRIGLSVLGSFKGLWANLQGAASAGMASVKNLIGSALNFIVNLFMKGITGYINLWKGLFTGLFGIVRNGWSVLQSAFGGALAAIRTVVATSVNAVRSSFSSAFNAIRTTVSGAINSVLSTLRALPGNAVRALGNLGGTLVSSGMNLIRGFITGITRMAGNVISAIRNTITDKLPDFVKKALGIHSPSRVFMALGEFTAEGMALGLANGAKGVQAAADALLPSTDYTLAAGIDPGAPGAPSAAVSSITVQISPQDLDGIRSIERFVAMARQQSRQMNGVTL